MALLATQSQKLDLDNRVDVNVSQVDGPMTGSTFQGVVTASWESLPATTPVSLGGRFSSNSDNIQDYNPTVVTVNGQPCSLSPNK